MVLSTAIYCTRVDEMSDLVALPKPEIYKPPRRMTIFHSAVGRRLR
jgi:hypothetical protein